MLSLLAAAAYFLAIHLLVSGTPVRDALTAKIGQGPYMGLFSLSSVAGLVWLGMAYAGFHGASGDTVFWTITPATRWLQLGLQLIAMLLIVPGITTPNPTSVRQEATLERPDVIKGMLRISRHPFLWGVALWALGHLIVNGDLAGLILFGSLLALAVFGTASIDAKRRRALGATWDAFAGKTSSLPFAAIAAGRQTLAIGEIGAWRLTLAVGVWAMAGWAHPILFGVRALP